MSPRATPRWAMLHTRHVRPCLTRAVERSLPADYHGTNASERQLHTLGSARRWNRSLSPLETGAIWSPRTIMDHAALTAAIGKSAFAIGVPARVVERLASVARLKLCPAGTTIFREGDYNHGFYLIHSGHVVLEMGTAAHGCRQLLTLGPGEILAWSTVIGNSRMTTTAIAQDAVQLIEMSGPDLAEACESDHEVGYQLMKRLAAALSLRLVATRMQLLDLFVADPAAAENPA